MSKRLTFILTVLLVFTGQVLVQAQGGVETLHKSTKKYITPVYMHNTNTKEEKLIAQYVDLDNILFPTNVGKVMIEDPVIAYNKDWSKALEAAKTPNKIIAKLFNDNGKWSYDKLLERARIDMTDADYQQFKSSAAGIRAGAGRKFYNAVLQSNYIILYSVSNVRTQEEVYDQIDAKNRKREEDDKNNSRLKEEKKYKFTPVKRTHTGYYASLISKIYRIDLSDENVADLEMVIYGENGDNSDAMKFDQLSKYPFKLTRISRKTEQIYSTAEKKKAREKGYDTAYFIKNMLTKSTFERMIKSGVDNLDDFQLKTTIYDTKKGIQVKVGTKEGIKRNSRFFVYEMRQKKNGKLKKKRVGAIRAKKPAKNEGLATGETKPTEFYQITGRRLGKGMILEEKKAMANLSLGYGNTGIYAGINNYVSWANATAIGFDYNGYTQARLDSVYIKTRTFSLYLEKEFHVIPNVSVGADAGLFYELTFFSDTLISEELGVPNQDENLNLRLGASANIYITPNYKLFGRYQFLPGKYGDETAFAMEGPYKIDRFRHRYYFGIVFVF
jgi:hypothetical protein